jgi:predicted XRE-type DNA-binding protein
MWCLVFAVRSALRQNIVSPIGPEVRGRILQLDALKHNIFLILYHLSLENVIVCERTVRRVLKTAKEAGTKPQQNARAAKKRNASSVRSPEVIKKIKRWTAQEDPLKPRYMARLTGVSQPTVSRIVNEDLDRVCLKKPTAPKLTDAQVAQRKVRAKPFSLLVSGGREQYILTLDDPWISLDFTNDQSPIYYAEKTKSERTRAKPVATSAPRFWQKTLYAADST